MWRGYMCAQGRATLDTQLFLLLFFLTECSVFTVTHKRAPRAAYDTTNSGVVQLTISQFLLSC